MKKKKSKIALMPLTSTRPVLPHGLYRSCYYYFLITHAFILQRFLAGFAIVLSPF